MKKNLFLWRVVGVILLTTLFFVVLAQVRNEEDVPPQQQTQDKNEEEATQQHPLIGETFPTYELETEDGKVFDFASGKPMIVTFFTSWCSYCHEAIDAYKEFTNERDDVNITLINVHSWEESDTDAPNYIKDENVEFPVLYDLKDEYTQALHIDGVPLNFILDEEGVVIDVIGGNISLESLERILPQKKGDNDRQRLLSKNPSRSKIGKSVSSMQENFSKSWVG